jgi:allophanate hydrolase subunit 2
MADRQTMGGYPKIAHVVSVDLPSLAQSRPGEHVRFNLVSLEQAQELDGARDAAFAELRAHLAPVRGILSGGSS